MKKVEVHTLKDVSNYREWFNKQELPQTMQINDAAYTDNLKATINHLLEQAKDCYDNPKMQGCFYLLDQIKANLTKK
jgi:hypothetical protein